MQCQILLWLFMSFLDVLFSYLIIFPLNMKWCFLVSHYVFTCTDCYTVNYMDTGQHLRCQVSKKVSRSSKSMCVQTKLKPNMAKMFSLMHQSVNDFSKRMSVEMRRNNYVTPTNYLELVDGYKQLRSATCCNSLSFGFTDDVVQLLWSWFQSLMLPPTTSIVMA